MGNTTMKLKTEELLHGIPLRITDTTLRDAHQSLWATRMRTGDILSIIDVVDNVGYYSLEAWGGATFDVCLRFLRENPWERLRLIKSKAKNTPLQMLLRGQNLVGYRNYADDVVDRFVALACKNGIDIFRVFDALNDTRNLEAAIKAVKKHGAHAQGTLAYTISPVHTVDKYLQYAKEQIALGIDSLCIKDMAGILSPIMAERLVSTLVKELGVPIQLHCHASSGMGTAAYVEGVRAGAGAIDCAISSMAGTSSQPPVETMAAIFSETNYSAGLDVAALDKVAKYFADLAPRRSAAPQSVMPIDPGILVHQIPGGMISNFRSQLQMQKALDKLPEVLDEVSRVREELGYPPLVTPTSQIVGTQAVMNIISGERYKIIPNEVKDYVRGMYGRSPVPIEKSMVKKILGDGKPINYRPADKIEPMLPKATDGVDPALINAEEDIISYVLLPEPALEYFKWKALPEASRPEIPADAEIRKAKGEQVAADANKQTQPTPASAQTPVATSVSTPAVHHPQPLVPPLPIDGLAAELIGKIDGLVIEEIVFRKGESTISVKSSSAQPTLAPRQGFDTVSAQPAYPSLPPPAAAQPATPAPQAESPKPEAAAYTKTIKAPLVGTFYLAPGPGKPAFVKEGDVVEKGAKVCIVEAMKLFNEISAPCRCKIVKIIAADGSAVDKDQELFGIAEV